MHELKKNKKPFSRGQPGDDVPAKTGWAAWDSLKEILKVCDFLEGTFLLENVCSLEIPPHTF